MIINSICVCGAGTMGSGIAQAAAQSGFHTLLYELNPAVLEKARTGIDKNLQSLVEKGKMPAAEKEKIQQRIHFTDDIQTCLADVQHRRLELGLGPLLARERGVVGVVRRHQPRA
jgi:3-hydroxybutyryl-CoA dehydrogenase